MERWEILLTEIHQRARVNPLVWAPLVCEFWARFDQFVVRDGMTKLYLCNELRHHLPGPEFTAG